MANQINQISCKKCGICIETCPENVLYTDSEGNTNFNPMTLHLCVKCAQCMAVCPSDSIRIEGIDAESTLINPGEDGVDYDQFRSFLSKRRSIRVFKDKVVPRSLIEKMIDACSLTPYGFNPQSVHITVIDDKVLLHEAYLKICALYQNLGKMMGKPISRFFVKRHVDDATYKTLLHHILPIIKMGRFNPDYGKDNILRNAPVLMIFHGKIDASEHIEDGWINTTYAMLAAHSLGLGTTVIGLVPPAINRNNEIKGLFGIPEDHEAISSLIIGFPKFKYKRSIYRPKQSINWM